MTGAEQVVRDYWQKVWIEQDLAALSDVVTDPVIRHTIDGTHVLTVAELQKRVSDALRTICGSELSFDAVTTDGDIVWTRMTLRGTTLTTMAPLTLTWMAQYRLADDRIAEMWVLHRSDLDWTE